MSTCVDMSDCVCRTSTGAGTPQKVVIMKSESNSDDDEPVAASRSSAVGKPHRVCCCTTNGCYAWLQPCSASLLARAEEALAAPTAGMTPKETTLRKLVEDLKACVVTMSALKN
jgi:hypothetical protein